MKKADVFEFFRRLAEENPAPETELEYGNVYQLLVAVTLSAQATDVGVNKATRKLFAQVKTPQDMLDLGEDGLKSHIKTIGLFNAKAKNVMALCARLMEAYDAQVPTTREALETLPGVGRKTANVWLNCALGLPTIGVDTHVFRVANRLGLCSTKNPLTTELALEKAIPTHWKQHAHHWLILHGRYVCKARAPECGRCSVRQWCAYPHKTA